MTVQSPTREQVAVIDRLRHRLRNAPDWANDVCVQRADLDAVLSLFPQPTPAPLIACPHWNNGGERGEVTMRKGCTACRAEARDAALVAELPSIADMAPEHSYEAMRTDIISALYEDGFSHIESEQLLRRFESTIRDVTPPPATSEEGDRG